MPAYVLAQTFITDQEKIKNYIELAPQTIKKYGGLYLARGGEMELLEGKWEVPRLVVAQFESMDVIRQWYNSPEYTEARAHRQGAGRYIMMALDGVRGQP